MKKITTTTTTTKHKGIKLVTLLPAKHGMFFIQMTTGAIRNKALREKKRLRLG